MDQDRFNRIRKGLQSAFAKEYTLRGVAIRLLIGNLILAVIATVVNYVAVHWLAVCYTFTAIAERPTRHSKKLAVTC